MSDVEVTGSCAVTVTADDRVVVRLPETATTGYRWSVADVHGPLAVESDGYVAPAGATPGAAGRRVVVLRPTGAGRGRVALTLTRRWEDEPVERVEVKVTVAD